MRLSVSVPVLSVAMTVTEPSASTADETPHDGLVPRHALDTECQRDCEHGRQAFRHGSDREGDGKQDDFRRPTSPRRRCRARRAPRQEQDPSSDLTAEFLDAALERRLRGMMSPSIVARRPIALAGRSS